MHALARGVLHSGSRNSVLDLRLTKQATKSPFICFSLSVCRDDSEATILPAPMSRDLLEAPPSPPQAHHQASRSVIVMPQHAPQQSVQQVETIPGRPVIKASAVRLVSSHLYQPFDQEKMGTLQSLFGKVPGTADQLYICLHPASAPGLPPVNPAFAPLRHQYISVSHTLAYRGGSFDELMRYKFLLDFRS